MRTTIPLCIFVTLFVIDASKLYHIINMNKIYKPILRRSYSIHIPIITPTEKKNETKLY